MSRIMVEARSKGLRITVDKGPGFWSVRS